MKVIKKKVVRDILYFLSSNTLFKLSSLVLTVFLSRILKPEGYGIYILTLSFSFIALSIINMGIPTAINKYIAENEDDPRIIRAYIYFFLKVSLSILAIFFLFLLLEKNNISLIFFKSLDFSGYVMLSFFLVFFLLFSSFLSSILSSMRKFDVIFKLKTVPEALLKLVLISSLSYFFSVKGGLIGFGFAYCFVVIILLIYLFRYHKYLFFGERAKINLSEVFTYLIFVNFSTISVTFYNWIDSLMLGYFLGFRDVAYYRVAFSLVGGVIAITSIHGVFLPRFAKYELRELKQKLPKIIVLSFFISLFPALFLISFKEKIITFVYGKEYLQSVYPLTILSFLIITQSLDFFSSVFNMRGFPQYTTFCISVSGLLNFFLNIWLIPIYGVNGAAIATLISRIVNLCLSFILYLLKF
ncbi:MAG: hypothetical protein DRN25_03610 [Thermoplasmata archaeon]|nr:MAG: hypothetical protein DRN25_03610 [Thermoplasmata archaeon]